MIHQGRDHCPARVPRTKLFRFHGFKQQSGSDTVAVTETRMDAVHFENKVGTLEGKCLDYPEDSGGTPGTLAGQNGNFSGIVWEL